MPLGMLGKYERLDVLGHGVSGIVYLAKDTLLNKQVALKEVDVQAGDMRRFLEEARVMDRLRHPNIVRVNGVDRIEGKIVIDMEYVRGENLQEILRVEGQLPADRALHIAAQTLDALDYAHQMQTVHRDIKPANILISRDGQVKLVDFGLAEILATNAYAGGAGTYAYMAPEDFAEEDRSDHLSDIWAVGVTLYEMLTAQRPFQVAKVKDPFAWKRVLETEAPTPLAAYLPDAPPGLQAILDRALARDKRQRYQTAGEFRDDLLRLREGVALSPLTLRYAETTTLSLLGEHRNGSAPVAVQPAGPPFAPVADDIREVSHPLFASNAGPPFAPVVGPGVVVADVSALPVPGETKEDATKGKRGPRLPFLGRKAGAAQLSIEPESVDFGAVRKGEQRTVKVQAKVTGMEGNVGGRVTRKPDWIAVSPVAFDRNKQTLTLTAHSERAWETGDFAERVRVESEAGAVEIPIRMRVLKPRPSFLQIAVWYVPLFAAALFPAMAVALGNNGRVDSTQIAMLVPPAATATGLLSAMLLLIGIAADIGIGERIACGVLTASMCLVLGLSLGEHSAAAFHKVVMERVTMTGGVIGAVMLLQLLYLSRWKLWAWALLALGIMIGSTFLRALIP